MKRSPRVSTTKHKENVKRYVKNIEYHELQIHIALTNMSFSKPAEHERTQAIISNRRARIARLRSRIQREEEKVAAIV